MSSVGNPIRGIVIHNDLEAYMSIIDLDVTHAFEFLKYPDILPAHRLVADPEQYELESYLFKQRMTKLEGDMQGETDTLFREWLGTMEPWKFQSLRYPCVHTVPVCAHALFNAEQYINKVYTLKCTLFIWGNEFPAFCDLSTWEVPSLTFKLVLDKGLCRKPKGRPQVTKIRNKMDMREKTDDKLCDMCKIFGHNRTKCS
ncbi:hypothetical protein GOBAR_DD01237 [Gossypium barbadense]|nr:hypothetical protein GOBAR_DD01237 [Gossypium barbadense]